MVCKSITIGASVKGKVTLKLATLGFAVDKGFGAVYVETADIGTWECSQIPESRIGELIMFIVSIDVITPGTVYIEFQWKKNGVQMAYGNNYTLNKNGEFAFDASNNGSNLYEKGSYSALTAIAT